MSQIVDTILISHSHKDEAYAKELIKIIEVTGVKGKNINIICSSCKGYGIPADINIYDYLKKEFKGNVWVIYLLSQNYYESAACLNEMGATWVQNKRYSTFLTPHFNFSEIQGAIDASKNSFKIDDKLKLNEFKDIIVKEFELGLDSNLWESVRDESLEKIEIFSRNELKKIQKQKVEVDSIRSIQDDKVDLALRLINQNSFHINFIFIKGKLKDSNGNVFKFETKSLDICTYNNENKVCFIKCSLDNAINTSNTNYTATIDDFGYTKTY